jgi:type IV pilus assembly protein PilW
VTCRDRRRASRNRFAATARAETGLTLIELMIALAIGAFLMAGAVALFVESRATYRTTEAVARLQENGRFALEALEPDVRMAGYLGLTARPASIVNRASAGDPDGVGTDTCGRNWLIDLDGFVDASSNTYDFGCRAHTSAVAGADTLVVRHAREEAVMGALAERRVYVQSARFPGGRLFDDAAPPAGFDGATSETHELSVNGYYVDATSSVAADLPSLRRKWLRGDGAIADEEILAGVEDLQVQFGVDSDPAGAANRGSIDRYVNPGDPMLSPGAAAFVPDARILAVRIWLRLRAERVENGFTDTAPYTYADRRAGPFGDGYRRLVVSKTIHLRNARAGI